MHHEPGLPRLRGRPGGSPRGRPWTATSGCRAPARPDRPRKLSAVRGSGGRYHLQERWRSHATRLRGTPPRHAGVRGVQPGGHRPACLPTAGGHRRYRANRTSHPAGQVASGACQCRAGSRYSGARTTAVRLNGLLKPVDGVPGRRRAGRGPGAGLLACLPGRLAAVRGVEGLERVQERLQLIAVDDGLAVRPGG